MPPRLDRGSVSLLIAAKVVVIIFVLVIATIVVSTVRAAIAPIIVPTTLIFSPLLAMLWTPRFGAKTVDNTPASSAQTRAFAALLPVMGASARAGARTGCRPAVAPAPAYVVRNSLQWGQTKDTYLY